MKVILIILFAGFLASCSTNRYNHESVHLKTGGELDKYHTRCQLITVKRTMQGYKHLFIADNGDTLKRVYERPLEVDSCYYIRKTRTEK